jgi:ATP-dependent protease Clp ATPase subunit
MSDVEPASRARLFRCSFCAKPQTQVKVLIGGPGVHICNECVALSAKILEDNMEQWVKHPTLRTMDKFETDELLRIIKLYDGAADAAFESMQDIVGVLREREVSWEQIGEALGVSRQAAWKRFA